MTTILEREYTMLPLQEHYCAGCGARGPVQLSTLFKLDSTERFALANGIQVINSRDSEKLSAIRSVYLLLGTLGVHRFALSKFFFDAYRDFMIQWDMRGIKKFAFEKVFREGDLVAHVIFSPIEAGNTNHAILVEFAYCRESYGSGILLHHMPGNLRTKLDLPYNP